MKKRLVQTITESGVNYGQVSHPQDLMKAQDFLHDRISYLTRDFLNNIKATEVTGLSYELGGGNSFEFTVSTPGRVYTQDGRSFDLLESATLEIAEADETHPRLDYVVAVLEEDVDAELALIPFVRLRTPDEFSDGAPAYPPQNTNAASEKHHRVVIQIKTGTPAAIPTPPATDSNEVPLYLIAVAPSAAQIREDDVLDVRDTILTLRRLNDLVGRNTFDLATLMLRTTRLEKLINQPIDLSHVFGSIKTLGDILASLQGQLNGIRNLPDVRYKIPKVGLVSPTTAKIPAAGNVDGLLPVVDIELGGIVNFDGIDVPLEPGRFVDETRNARLVKVTDNPETDTIATGLSLGTVEQTAADGFTDFVPRAASFAASRSRPAACARNNQFIELIGGLASDNATKLGDWMSYDVLNDTITPRVPSIALPQSDAPSLMPCGDGINVLFIAGRSDDQSPQCFKINAATYVVTEILSTKPTGDQFFGDLIAPGKIFIVAVKKAEIGYVTEFWEFDTALNTFTEIGVTGSVPEFATDFAHGCFLKVNQFVAVGFTPGGSASGKTYVFDRTSSVWTEQPIANPYGGSPLVQLPLQGFRMANVNGRPLLVGALLTKDTDNGKAKVWELIATPQTSPGLKHYWLHSDATFPPLRSPGFCSTIIAGYAAGLAGMFAGQGKYSDAKVQIYASIQGGLIATTFLGLPAITIADNSRFVEFTVPVYTTEWPAASYLLSLVGSFDQFNMNVSASFDGGDTWEVIDPGVMHLVQNADASGDRLLRFALYNFPSNKPILARMIEVFDEDGPNLETRVVLRYDAPAVDSALYVTRQGTIELSEAVVPSNPDRCLLHKVTLTGVDDPPDVKSYINRRNPHFKYTGESDGSPESVSFENDFAVPIRYVSARAIVAAGNHLYHVEDPEVDFDSPVSLAGVASGDGWIVDIEG